MILPDDDVPYVLGQHRPSLAELRAELERTSTSPDLDAPWWQAPPEAAGWRQAPGEAAHWSQAAPDAAHWWQAPVVVVGTGVVAAAGALVAWAALASTSG